MYALNNKKVLLSRSQGINQYYLNAQLHHLKFSIVGWLC